jgi:hypothetical protein
MLSLRHLLFFIPVSGSPENSENGAYWSLFTGLIVGNLNITGYI